jgi:hypothetical protein
MFLREELIADHESVKNEIQTIQCLHVVSTFLTMSNPYFSSIIQLHSCIFGVGTYALQYFWSGKLTTPIPTKSLEYTNCATQNIVVGNNGISFGSFLNPVWEYMCCMSKLKTS